MQSEMDVWSLPEPERTDGQGCHKRVLVVREFSRAVSYYANQFQTVEADSTFYGCPSASTVSNWSARTPEDFLFCVKVPRIIGVSWNIARSVRKNSNGNFHECKGWLMETVFSVNPQYQIAAPQKWYPALSHQANPRWHNRADTDIFYQGYYPVYVLLSGCLRGISS